MNIHAPMPDFDLSKLLTLEDYTFTLPDLSKMKDMDEERVRVSEIKNKINIDIQDKQKGIMLTRKSQKLINKLINFIDFAPDVKLNNQTIELINKYDSFLNNTAYKNYVSTLKKLDNLILNKKLKQKLENKINKFIEISNLHFKEMNENVLMLKILERKTAPHPPELRTITSAQDLRKFMLEEI